MPRNKIHGIFFLWDAQNPLMNNVALYKLFGFQIRIYHYSKFINLSFHDICILYFQVNEI